MLETIIEFVTATFAAIGILMYLHYAAYAISWGWQKGRAKVKREVYNYHINK
jgi:hypothetical protein